MKRPVVILELPEEVRMKLQSMGFEYVEDIEYVLANADKIPHSIKTFFNEHKIEEIVNNLKIVVNVESVADKILRECPPISLFHAGLDKLLNGGLPVGRITELCGPPGCGKTQLCLQFCVDVQIPEEIGGSEGEALYISTDFCFQVERLREIIQATIDHCSSMEYSDNALKEKVLNKLTINGMLDKIKVARIYNVQQLVKILESLKSLLERDHNIKLLIIDSFSLPFILDMEDLLVRTKIISNILSILRELAMANKIAVVLTNQLMTIITGEDSSIVKPSLGQAYAHLIHQRLMISENKIFLTKSVEQPELSMNFKITKDGIR